MNFTREIKRELLKKFPGRDCCKRAALVGLLCVCGTGSGGEILFTTEQEDVAAFALEASELFGVRPELSGVSFDPKQGRDKLSFSLERREVGEDLLKEECCKISFLSGAFLGGGSCTLPKEGKKTGYHLEIPFERESGAETFGRLCEELQLLPPGIIERKGKTVAYFKSREGIADFLALVGAESALKTLEEVSSLREESNLENRKGNCFAGNADKAAIASAAQVLSIERLKSEGTLMKLPPPLKETALARLENPELSLSELAQKLSLSKSCLYHRLQKLSFLSEKKS